MNTAAWLHTPDENTHKYSRGVLAVRTGSTRYPGAAVLGVEAAWRTGIGMVRYVAPSESVAQLVLHRRPETVTEDGDSDAWLMGSGMVLNPAMPHKREAIVRALGESKPVVLDAGPTEVLEPQQHPVAPTIITPHAGEFLTLWRKLGTRDPVLASPPARVRAVTTLAKALGVTILLKGSVTVLAAPSGRVAQSSPATAWLATAGTGDVLGGILGALVASHADAVLGDPDTLVDLGLAATTVHDAAARLAAHGSIGLDADPSHGRPITALDVAEAIPHAVQALRA